MNQKNSRAVQAAGYHLASALMKMPCRIIYGKGALSQFFDGEELGDLGQSEFLSISITQVGVILNNRGEKYHNTIISHVSDAETLNFSDLTRCRSPDVL